jgi:hypothetical protein
LSDGHINRLKTLRQADHDLKPIAHEQIDLFPTRMSQAIRINHLVGVRIFQLEHLGLLGLKIDTEADGVRDHCRDTPLTIIGQVDESKIAIDRNDLAVDGDIVINARRDAKGRSDSDVLQVRDQVGKLAEETAIDRQVVAHFHAPVVDDGLKGIPRTTCS